MTIRILLSQGLILALVLWLGVSCAPWRTESYLEGAVYQATQEEVANRLGPPNVIRELPSNGGTLWIYQYPTELLARGIEDVPARGIDDGADWRRVCIEYLLTFGLEKVLRSWQQQPCSQL